MRKKQGKKLNMALVLLLGALLLMLPIQALSGGHSGNKNPKDPIADNPPVPGGPCANPDGDLDNDGFTNAQECGDGLVANGTTVFLNYPSCVYADGTDNPAYIPYHRNECLHPNGKDLLIILNKLPEGSLIPDPLNALQYVNYPQVDAAGDVTGYLGVTIHFIDGSTLPPDRSVIYNGPNNQKAVSVTETKELTGKFGKTEHGTPPTGQDATKIYTYQIKEYVNNVYGDSADHTAVVNELIFQTMSHEVGHDINLYIQENPRYDGWHLKPGTGYIMDAEIKVQGTNFSIPNIFSDASIDGFLLTEPQ